MMMVLDGAGRMGWVVQVEPKHASWIVVREARFVNGAKKDILDPASREAKS